MITINVSKNEIRAAIRVQRHFRGFEVRKRLQVCPITLGAITKTNSSVTECGHIFDRDALENWLSDKTTCPVCRRSIRRPINSNVPDTRDNVPDTRDIIALAIVTNRFAAELTHDGSANIARAIATIGEQSRLDSIPQMLATMGAVQLTDNGRAEIIRAIRGLN